MPNKNITMTKLRTIIRLYEDRMGFNCAISIDTIQNK